MNTALFITIDFLTDLDYYLIKQERIGMYKKLLLLVICLSFIFCGCGKKKEIEDDLSRIMKQDKITIGVRTDTMPFGFKDKNGEYAGYDIDIAKIITAALLGDEKKVQFVPVTASDRIRKLITKEVDMLIATISITEPRQRILDFSVPYYIAGQAMMLPAKSDIISLRELEDKTVIIVYGSTSERSIRSSIPNVNILGYKTYDAAYQAMKSGVADALIADDTLLFRYTLNDPSLKLLPKRYSKEYYAIAFRKEDASQRLQMRINSVLHSLISTGRLNRLQEKWGISD